MENHVKPVNAGNRDSIMKVTNDGRMVVRCSLFGTSQCPNPDCSGYHYCPCSKNHSDN